MLKLLPPYSPRYAARCPLPLPSSPLPAAIAAERESLLDEITRLVDQAGTSTELLNELILNKSPVRCCVQRAGQEGQGRG